MLKAEQCRSLMNVNTDITLKRSIYELSNINSLIYHRCLSNKSFLTFSVYRNSLNIKQFVDLLKKIKDRLKDHGYSLTRIDYDSDEVYIFNISWTDINISDLDV